MQTTSNWLSGTAAGIATVVMLVLVAGVVAERSIPQWSMTAEEYRARYHGESQTGPREDYVAFYAAATLVREGRGADIYDVDVSETRQHELMGRPVGGTGFLAYLNPPFVAAALLPLTFLSPPHAALAFGIGALASVAVGVFLLTRTQTSARDRFVLVALAVLFAPVPWLVLHGQFSMLILIGLVGFVLRERQGRPRSAGVALALTLIKPQFAVLPIVLLAWKRRWVELSVFVSIGAALALLSVLVSGPSVLWSYPVYLLESRTWDGHSGQTPANMYGWSGFVARYIPYLSVPHLIVTAVLTVGTIAALAAVFRGPWAPRDSRFLLQTSALLAAILLTTPHLHLQDVAIVGAAIALGYAGTAGLPDYRNVWLWLAAIALLSTSFAHRLLHLDVNVVTPTVALVFAVAAFTSLRTLSTTRPPSTLPTKSAPAPPVPT